MSRRISSSRYRLIALTSTAAVALAGLGTTTLVRGHRHAAKAPMAPQSRPATPAGSTMQVRSQLAQLPMAFEANQGQTDPQVQFIARAASSMVFLTGSEAVLKVAPPGCAALSGMALEACRAHRAQAPSGVLRMRFAKAAATQGTGEQMIGKSNYIRSHGAGSLTGVPGYAKVAYTNVYPGVDAVYYGHEGALEYDLNVAPQAATAAIQIAFDGAPLRLSAAGELNFTLAGQTVVMRQPVAYQTVNGKRQAVAVRYTEAGNNTVGFALGSYDHRRTVVIDPVLSFATFLGGSAFDQANAVAVDASGNAYVAGATQSTNFPTVTPVQSALNGTSFDVFVTKVAPTGNSITYSTYLGGSGDDEATGIAVDATGNAYVTGFTSSTNYPTTTGAYSVVAGGGYDAFISKLNPAGTALVYSTLLGGAQDDKAAAITVDGSGDAFVTGYTASTNFPTSAGAPQTASLIAGGSNAFVTELNPAGTALLMSTYLGGQNLIASFPSQNENSVSRATGIALDPSSNVYVCGYTSSSDFKFSPGAYQTAFGGVFDAFVTEIDRSGKSIDFSTYLGGAKDDEANAIAVDAGSNVFVTGQTSSTNFPVTSAFRQTSSGGQDIFITEIARGSGANLSYSTYLGGSANDVGTAIAVDASDNAYVTGYTTSTDLPTGSNAVQSALAGNSDAFIAKLNASGNQVPFLSYYGGSGIDQGTGVAIDTAGDLYFSGLTQSPDFPTTTGVVQAAIGGATDGFLIKMITSPQAVFSPTTLGFPSQASAVASASETAILSNGGEKPLLISSIATTGPYSQTNTCPVSPATLAPSAQCNVTIVFTPTASGAQNGTLVVSDNAPGGAQTLPLTGTGGDFTLAVAPTTQTISAGSSASFSITVTPANGYTQVVNLTCTGIPAQATCVPSPTSLTMNGISASAATYTVTTTVRPSLIPGAPGFKPGGRLMLLLGWLSLMLFAGALMMRRMAPRFVRAPRWIGTALLVGWAVAAVGCGGTSTNPGTPAANDTLTFTGTAGAVNHSVTISLTVN